MEDSAPPTIEDRRREATVGLDRAHRSSFGQFFTPAPTARFMASLIEPVAAHVPAILDPGAGIGLLSIALLDHLKGRAAVTAYELEPHFQKGLHETLSHFPGTHRVEHRDFIEHAVTLASTGKGSRYDIAILNPPYKKIQSGSAHRALLRKLGVETSNLYTCFLACAIALCVKGAQVVAIIPRSWMNGVYFRPFRYWLLDRVALTRTHVFDRRDRAFSDDGVLQENVIVKLVVGAPQGAVEVSASSDDRFHDVRKKVVSFSEVVTPGDKEKFIHIPTLGSVATAGLPGKPLREIGLDICTGPVVDFRLRAHLHMLPESGDAPLLYATHFSGGVVEWPKQTRKPNAIAINDETRQWLMPAGTYVVTRRFTSKEERRRVVAFFLSGDALRGAAWVGFENHLNVFHCNKRGLEPAVARGLCVYLNSQPVDDYFRTFSGHTQVNATDLRRLCYPSQEELRAIGDRNAQESPRGAGNIG